MSTLYVPHTRVEEATQAYLLQEQSFPDTVWPNDQRYPRFSVEYVDVSGGPQDYTRHLQQCWEKGQTFINLEHDIVPWPGAIASLLECPQPWCAFGYLPYLDITTNAPNLGLAKFSDVFISATPQLWQRMPSRPAQWRYNDMWLWEYAKTHGLLPHQHWPSVLNLGPLTPQERS